MGIAMATVSLSPEQTRTHGVWDVSFERMLEMETAVDDDECVDKSGREGSGGANHWLRGRQRSEKQTRKKKKTSSGQSYKEFGQRAGTMQQKKKSR